MEVDYNEKYPVRILHILGSAQRGGTESVVFNNYRAIDRNIVQFDIVIDDCSPYDIPEDIKNLGCEVYRIPPYTKLPLYLKSIRNICKKGNYKIVHSHMNTMSVFPLFAAWFAKVPVRIAHSHSTAGNGNDFKRDLLKCLLRPFSKMFATHYFACSEHAARWLFGDRTFEQGKVTVLNNAIDTENFKFSPQTRKNLRCQLGLNEKFAIGHVGRFSPQKNHYFLIDVFNALCKLRADCVLLLIGGSGSAGGNIEDGVRKKIEELGLKDKVLFLGTREDISELYQSMDVFILPSLYEGLGMAVLEAQCSGLPCVLSDRVPIEAKINENVSFLSLDTPLEKWAKVISESKGERADYSAQLANAGYDIRVVARQLKKSYLEYYTSAKYKKG